MTVCSILRGKTVKFKYNQQSRTQITPLRPVFNTETSRAIAGYCGAAQLHVISNRTGELSRNMRPRKRRFKSKLIDLLACYVLFSQVRPRNVLQEICRLSFQKLCIHMNMEAST